MEEFNYFKIIFMGGGGIGYLIWLISVVTVALIVQYLITIRRANIMPMLVHMQIQELFENKQYREAI